MSTKTTKTKKLKSSKASVSKTTSRFKTIKATIRHHKLLSFLILIIILIATNYGYIKYQDWDNAQLIKGLARDFPLLVDQIERETGLNLSKRSDCSKTTEKFSGGVRTCELLVVRTTVGDRSGSERLMSIVLEDPSFAARDRFASESEDKEGYNIKYRQKKACQVAIGTRGENSAVFHCITAVREANIELAKDLFNDPRFADWNDKGSTE